MTFNPSATQRIILRAKRRIVPNWRSRLGDYSTKALALGVTMAASWAALSSDLKAHLPADYVAWVIGGLNAFGLASRFFIQGELPPEKPNADK